MAEGKTAIVDARCKGIKKIEVITHEALHILMPGMAEDDVVRVSAIMARTLWHEGIRPVENDVHRLQDE